MRLNKKVRFVNVAISLVALFLNIVQPFVLAAISSPLVKSAYAEEVVVEPTPSPESEIVVEPSTEPEILPEASPSISPDPSTDPSTSPDPSPIDTTESPTLTATVIEPSTPSIDDGFDFSTTEVASATIVTDKPDYAPTETVIITASDLLPLNTYEIKISSTDPPTVTFSDSVATTDTGAFTYSYTLDGNYRPDYLVEVKDEDSVIVSTTFTDTDPAPVINYVSFNPPGGTSGIGETIKVTFKVGTTPGLSGTATVNGHTYTLSSVYGGEYDAFYVIQEGDPSIAEGSQIPVSVELWNQSHTDYTTNYGDHFVDPGIDATRPTCSLVIAENPDQNGQYASAENLYFNTNVISTGNFKVVATPSDSNGIQKVSFPTIIGYNGGGNEDISDPYEGTYTWFSASQPTSNNLITCYDNAGNTNTAVFNILKDTTHPVINDVDLSDDTVKNTDVVTVTGDITETGSGIASCQAYLSPNTSTYLTGDTLLGDWGANCQYNYTVNLADGTYYFKLKLGDKVGNFTDAKASGPMVVDSIYPTTTDDAGPGNGPAVLSSQTVTLTPNDLGGSGLADTKYCIEDSGTICTPDISGTSVIVSCPGEASCTKWIFYYSIDNSGNASSPEHSHNINIYNDLIAPSTTDDIDGAWHNTDVTVNLSCTDNDGGTGCATTYYTTDGTDPTTASTTSNSFTLSSDGIYTIKYFSKDVAGNAETVVTSDNQVKVDKTNPTTPGTPTTTSPTNDNTPTWTWAGSTDNILLSGYRFYWNNILDDETNYDELGTSTTFTSELLTDGLWYGKVKAFDSTGNISESSGVGSVLIDTVAPTLNVTGFTADTVAMSGNISDGYTLNSDNDPAHEFLVQFDPATDANETLASTHFGLYLTDSTVSQADLKTYYDNRGTPDPYLSYLKDAVDGTQPFALINGSTLKLVDAARYTYQSIDTDMAVPGNYPLGTYTLSGQIQDLAGNSTTVTYKLIVAGDRVGPTMTAVSTTTADGAYTIGQVIDFAVTFDEAVTVSGLPEFAVSAGPGSKAVYASGSGTDTLIFNYTVATDDGTPTYLSHNNGDLVLNGGTITDSSSNNVNITLPDNSAFLATHSIVIDTQNPTGSIDSPNSNDILNGTVTITATGSDSGSAVDRVQFYHSSINPIDIGQDNTSPYSIDWDTTGVVDGSHTIFIKVFDNAGNYSGFYNIPVTIDNTSPAIAFTNKVEVGPVQTDDVIITVSDDNLSSYNYGFSLDSTCDVSDTYDQSFTSGSAITFSDETYNGQWICVEASDLAGNISYSNSTDALNIDVTPPQLIYAETKDFDGNGKIDAIELTFSEDINDGQLATTGPDGWTLDDYIVSKVDSGKGPNDDILFLNLVEGTGVDSGNTPMVTYTKQPTTVSTHDIAGNQLETVTYGTNDGARPVVLSAETQDINGNGQLDAIKLTFSENINDEMLDPGNPDGWDVDGYDGEAIGSGNSLNDNILILSFEEIGSYDVDTTPTIKYTNSADLFSTHDLAGNQLATYEVTTIDKSAPTAPTADPAGDDYDSDQLVVLSSAERGTEIRYTTDGVDPTASTGTVYDQEILIDSSSTLKAIAIDGYGNVSPVMTEIYGIAPVISSETSSSVTSSSVTITWTTDDPSTSRVIYDTVSHTLGVSPNYGYASSTIEDSTKVTSHSVDLTGLSADTTYYYRTVSHGSPESVSDERTTKTSTTTSSSSDSGSGGTSTSTSTVCNDEKPGTPTLLSAEATVANTVVLTWALAPDPVTYYLVAYGTSSGTIQYGNPNVGGHDTTTATISGLSAGTTYYFVVRAGNGCATGDFSNELSVNPSGEVLPFGPATGFEEGVLGSSTDSDVDTNSPEYLKQNDENGEVMGETKPFASRWWYWLILIPVGWFGYALLKKRH